MESHARGSILVAAVFEAFINIYKNRVLICYELLPMEPVFCPKGNFIPIL